MPFARAWIARSLAALATFGLVLVPVLHAQLHASEAEQEQGPGWSGALEAGHHQGEGEEHHRHSHGPGPHGAGSLEHLALAVHAAPDSANGAALERVPDRPALAPVTLHLTPRYLVPDFSQGPPRA